jgi:predicted nucleic acid-binding protein
MYVVGNDHPLKSQSKSLLLAAVRRREPLITDTEVLQEILHRYRSINRPTEMRWAFDLVLNVADEIHSIDLVDVLSARLILTTNTRISARDAIHAAVMQRNGITRLLSFDAGFDEVPDIQRITS